MPIDVVMGAGPKREKRRLSRTESGVQREVRGHLKDTSSLPVAMFDACDPMTEAVLAQAAVSLILDHMGLSDELEDREPGEQRVENVDPQEIQALCQHLVWTTEVSPPSLMGGLTRERLWVLLDLVMTGSPGARVQAATRIHETITEILNPESLDPMLLGQVTSLLQEACLRDDMPDLLWDLLHRAAGRQVDRQDAGPDGEER